MDACKKRNQNLATPSLETQITVRVEVRVCCFTLYVADLLFHLVAKNAKDEGIFLSSASGIGFMVHMQQWIAAQIV